ncbi:hypothetical protein ACFQY3_19255 [Paenibacillus farraposensis]|uniref:hypothetical protein n=1 Tax=Paenibacillus farraposensis TaxID=2807095 RepID=UPI0036190504
MIRKTHISIPPADHRGGIAGAAGNRKNNGCHGSLPGERKFFLDVYDVKYDSALLQKIARNIHLRGHEVELHTHPFGRLPFYSKPIYEYPLREQINILEYGKHFIAEQTGSCPIAHRGGSYAVDENTLYALSEIGIPIDSSVFYQHPNNHLEQIPTTNKTISYYNIIEIPVTYVKIISKTGERLKSKFDLDWLSYDELVKVIQLAKAHGLRKMTLFCTAFHLSTRKPSLLVLLRIPRLCSGINHRVERCTVKSTEPTIRIFLPSKSCFTT